jgi:hypothetical protein
MSIQVVLSAANINSVHVNPKLINGILTILPAQLVSVNCLQALEVIWVLSSSG